MTIEAVVYISDLDESLPRPTDPRSEGDDHIRNSKRCLKQTFPGAAGEGFSKPITASEDELNRVKGVTSPIQDQIDGLDGKFVEIDGGDQDINGGLAIKHYLTIRGESAGGDEYIQMMDSAGKSKCTIKDDTSANHEVSITQQGPGAVGADTILRMHEGKLQVSSDNGYTSDPIDPKDLVTKEWLESYALHEDPTGNVEIAGMLTLHEEVRIIADTANPTDGISFYMVHPQNQTLNIRAAMFMREEDTQGAPEITLRWAIGDENGTPVTQMIYYPTGELRIDNHAVLTTLNHPTLLSTLHDAGGVDGSFIDGEGKTITVTDGLITDLG